jgi:hypothetical protein
VGLRQKHNLCDLRDSAVKHCLWQMTLSFEWFLICPKGMDEEYLAVLALP